MTSVKMFTLVTSLKIYLKLKLIVIVIINDESTQKKNG